MEVVELISFKIISAVGTARSSYIHAIKKAKELQFEEAKQLMKSGEAAFIDGHKTHALLIQQVASGEEIPMDLLLVHAEDQLMSAESFKIIAEEFIDVYSRMNANQNGELEI